MSEINQMISGMRDQREAQSAWTPDGESGWRVGQNKVVRITVYPEHGEMSWVPYLRIEMKDGSTCRTAARHYEVNFDAINEAGGE